MSGRILAICWDMPPLSGPRAVQVSRTLKHLVPLGWESSVICFSPRSGRYNQDDDLAQRLRMPVGVRLVRVRSPEERFVFRALWRIVPPAKLLPDEKWVWIPAATRAGRRVVDEQQVDRIVSFAQPWSDHLIGRRLRRETGLPWIAHFSDPWIDSPYLHGRRWQQRIWRRMEACVVRDADALVFVNSQTADRVMRKYPDAWRHKVSVVPHGFDCDDLRAAAPAPRDGRLTIVYTGRFYDRMRTPEPLLHALASVRARRQLDEVLRFVFVGTDVRAHRRLAAALGLSAVVDFTGRLSFAASAAWVAAADVLLLIDAPADESLFLPSKLVDYLPAAKPILALTPARGASADLVRQLGYPVVAPDDVPAIAAAIERLLDQRPVSASPSHAQIAAQYDIRCTAAAFADILARCA
ncbi:MAG TPA: glycosyltransferase [Vicinamibacterales bacterium]|nr:glycosyltransferase [Vicinamibacterales bacterium]